MLLNLHRILLLSLLLFASCCSPTNLSEGGDFDIYDKKITTEFIKQEKKNQKLRCIGTGLRVPEDKILYFSFIFLIEDNISINEARSLIVTITKDCAALILRDQNSSKFLMKSPDSIENAQIDILIRRTDGQEKTTVAYVSSFFNKLYYSKWGKNDNFEDFYEETFEEAERILAEQNKIGVEVTNDAEPT